MSLPEQTQPASVVLSRTDDRQGLNPVVTAIIVTWQPELPALEKLLSSLLTQHCPVIVVDNGSDNINALRAVLERLADSHKAVTAPRLISWTQNKGLAAAMNEGLRQVQQAACPFVLLFDQDSQISADFVAAMLAQWQQLDALTSARADYRAPAALGPRLQDPRTGKLTPFRCFRWRQRSDSPVNGVPGLFATDFLISSGSLIAMDALQTVGVMKEDYFIDNIDLEWCFRARAAGFALYGTNSARLFHRIGEDSHNPLVRSGLMVQHSPLRAYYSTRNRMHLWRQPYAPQDWKMRDKVRFVLKSLWLISFTSQRRQYREQIRRGIDDAKRLV